MLKNSWYNVLPTMARAIDLRPKGVTGYQFYKSVVSADGIVVITDPKQLL
jgi:hypothetical protein